MLNKSRGSGIAHNFLYMKSPEEEPVKELVQFKKGELSDHSAFEVLANVRSENVWLANFSSENMR